MPKSGLIRFFIILAVTTVVYFIAGFFMDLPPYGIIVKNTDTKMKTDGKNMFVNVEILFHCISRFPRKNDFFFPIYSSGEQSKGENIQGFEEGKDIGRREANFRKTDSGVIYRLSLKPGESRKVNFSFQQKISGDSFVCNFTRMTGWNNKADTINYTVEVPRKFALHTLPPHNFDEETGNVRIFKMERKEGTDPGMMMKWDRGE